MADMLFFFKQLNVHTSPESRKRAATSGQSAIIATIRRCVLILKSHMVDGEILPLSMRAETDRNGNGVRRIRLRGDILMSYSARVCVCVYVFKEKTERA